MLMLLEMVCIYCCCGDCCGMRKIIKKRQVLFLHTKSQVTDFHTISPSDDSGNDLGSDFLSPEMDCGSLIYTGPIAQNAQYLVCTVLQDKTHFNWTQVEIDCIFTGFFLVGQQL